MDVPLQLQRSVCCRTSFPERTHLKIKSFVGLSSHGRTSPSSQSSHRRAESSAMGMSYRLNASADFSRKKPKKVSIPGPKGPSPKGFVPRTKAGTSTQKRDQISNKGKNDPSTSMHSEYAGPRKNPAELRVDVDEEEQENEFSPGSHVDEEQSEIDDEVDKISSGDIQSVEVEHGQFRENRRTSRIDEYATEKQKSEIPRIDTEERGDEIAASKSWSDVIKSDDIEETAVEIDEDIPSIELAKTGLLGENDSLVCEEPNKDVPSLKLKQEMDEEVSKRVLEDIPSIELAKTGLLGENDSLVREEPNKDVSSLKLKQEMDEEVRKRVLEDLPSIELAKTGLIGENDSLVCEEPNKDVSSLKLKQEMDEEVRKRVLEDLAEENFYGGNKMFVYPKVVKPDQDVEIFLNRSLSTLKNEPTIMIMGAFNDWRWKSFTVKLNKTNLKGDWWSCQITVPKVAYKIDFVFFNGGDAYDNNDKKDFFIPVEGGMDAFAFEDFLLEEKRRELEKLAAEQAERERQAEEQRRIEAEMAAREADRAQARLEVERRQEMLQNSMKKAVKSVDDVWCIVPSDFKSKDLVRLYYNRSSGPLAHAKDIWIHGGHNNWMDGLSIVERLIRSKRKDGDWWYADVVVPDRALVLDWVFADGPPQIAVLYDNNHRQDFHAIVPKFIAEEVYWAEEEQKICRKLQEERRLREEAIRAKAEKTARMKAEMKERTMKMFLLSQKHIVYTEPLDVRAGSTVTVFYNPSNTVLNGKPEVWFRCSFNRWTHRNGQLPPQKMLPVENSSHLRATVKVPLDAYMMDFVFSEKEDGGIYDNKHGMDYHVPVFGGLAKEPPMHVVHVAAEMAPIAKVGGLGDVVTSLSRAVQDLGHNVDIILPKYDCLNLSNVTEFQFCRSYFWGGTEIKVWSGKVEGLSVYFLEPQNGMFSAGCIYGRNNDGERFSFFCHAALEFLLQGGFHPDILHCHDWTSAPVSWLYKDLYTHYGLSKARVVFTIHNLEFGAQLIGKAMEFSDKATTVSPTYSKEVSGNPVIAPHIYKLRGILNGIDPDIWDPYNDKFIPISYTSENVIEGKRAAKGALQERLNLKRSDVPLIGIITRLTVQKGIHLIKHAIGRTLERGGQVVLLGSAPDPRIQNDFVNLANQLHSSHGDRARLCLTYDEPLSHLIYAGSDFILAPSIFEPCGLTQLIAMRYGSIPVVRKTGGLYDTVFDVDHDKERAQAHGLEPNGFNFDGADSGGVDYALNRAISAWYVGRDWFNSLCKQVMEQDWTWNRPALDYMELYHAARK